LIIRKAKRLPKKVESKAINVAIPTLFSNKKSSFVRNNPLLISTISLEKKTNKTV
jgi:hypothetical protein